MDACLSRLPSVKVYKDFDVLGGLSTDEPLAAMLVNDVLLALQPYSQSDGCAKKIGYAWYHGVEKKQGRSLLDDKYCGALYFWIGEQVFKELKGQNSQFQNVMEKVYKALKSSCSNITYNKLYSRNNESDFKKRKTIFDYWNNHETIKNYLAEGKGSCGGKYYNYLDKIGNDYNNMNSHCASHTDDEFCKKINDIFVGDNNNPNEVKSKCLSKHKNNFTSLSDVAEEGEDSKKLPSEQAYDLLDGGPWCSVLHGVQKQNEEQTIKGELEKILNEYTDIPNNKNGDVANEILQNYCYACWMREQLESKSQPDNDTPCYFLFFWIFNEIKDKLKRVGTFHKAMNAIYAVLQTFSWNGISKNRNKCTNIYPHIMESFCQVLKKFFDYEYNIKAIEKKPECNKYFSSQYTKDRANADEGYKLSCSLCNDGTSEYCNEFKGKYISTGKCTPIPKLPALTCPVRPPVAVKPATAAKPVAAKPAATGTCNPSSSGHGSVCGDNVVDGFYGGEGKGGSDGGGSHRKEGEEGDDGVGGIVPGVSGGLAAIGLPTIMLLLYKYTSLPLLLRNKFGESNSEGRKRRKRSNLQHDIDDTLTEYGSTDYSNSDLTDDSSSLYTTTTTTRSSSNRTNRRRKNINYAELTVDDLNLLPSQKKYAEFNTGWRSSYSGFCNSSVDVKPKIKSTLSAYQGHDQYAEQIVNIYCYASTMDSNNPYGTWCQYFYFWLGHLLINTLRVDSYVNTMDRIYGDLKGVLNGKKCALMYNNISKDIFPQVKIHFDYEQDYPTLQSQLGTDGKKSCNDEYNQHLDAIKEACKNVTADCTTGTGKNASGQYCGKFNAKKGNDGDYCKNEILQKLHCEEVTVPPTEGETVHVVFSQGSSMGGGDGGSSTTSTGTVVSSTLGTALVGLLAITFFLYKLQKELPSWKEFYDKFENATEYTCSSNGKLADLEKPLRDALSGYPTISPLTGKIVKAYCYTSKKEEEYASTGDKAQYKGAPCKFFYHWIGEQVFSSTVKYSVRGALDIINDKLSSIGNGHECNFNYKDIDKDPLEGGKDLFGNRKKVFDHYYDYEGIKQYLRGREYDCAREKEEYKADVEEACEEVKQYCSAGGQGKNNNDPYCDEFTDKYIQYCEDEKLSELECESNALVVSVQVQHTHDPAEEKGFQDIQAAPAPTSSEGSNTAAPIISSIIPIVGLPTILFFLYKQDQNHCSEDNLPSRRVYKAFEHKNGGKHQHTCTEMSTWTTEIERILDKKLSNQWQHEARKYATEIAQAWCLICTMNKEKEQQLCTKVCDFFYFWLERMLSGKLRSLSANVQDIMKEIYSKLEGSSSGNQCTYETMHKTIGETLLPQRKKVFDYYHDYRNIWKELKVCTSDDSSCTGKYDTYLSEATTAYSMVSANCGNGEETNNNDDFCKKFKEKFDGNGNDGKIPKPGDLKSKAMADQEPPSDDEGDEDGANLVNCLTQLSSVVAALPQHKEITKEVTSTTVENPSTSTPTIVSSAAAALIGLPTAAFFLYKVNTTAITTIIIFYLLEYITPFLEEEKGTTTGIETPILYSDWVYDMFNKGCGTCDPDNRMDSLETKFRDSEKLKILMDIVKYAWCFVSKMRETNMEDNDICNFFYYWLGDRVKESVGEGNFSSSMDNVYAALKEVLDGNECNCNPLNQHSKWEIFEQEKKKFDLKHNYEPEPTKLQSYYDSCDSQYRQEDGRKTPPNVPSASDVKKQCANSGGSDPNSSYCTKFWEKYSDYCKKEASSGLYTSLFDMVKNSFFGDSNNITNNRNSNSRNRGKRSIRYDFDTLTSTDDTSTGRSTIGIMAPDDDVIPLPSEEIYKEFDGRNRSCTGVREGPECNQAVRTKVLNTLKVYDREVLGKDETLASGIVQNYYYACRKDTGNQSDNALCYFLFFWIGDKIKDRLKTKGTFGKGMDAIYAELGNFPWDKGISKKRVCTNIYPNIMGFKCEALKNFFDYKYNINALRENSNCNGYVGTLEQTAISGNVQNIYSWSCGICTSDDIEYCKDFRQNHSNCSTEPLPKLTCTPQAPPIPQLPQTCQDKGLPSQMVYCQIGEAQEEYNDREQCRTEGIRTDLDSILTRYGVLGDYGDQIVHGFCYASKAREPPNPSNDWCSYFYYWLHNSLHTMREPDKNFETIMKGIYEKLKQLKVDKPCTNFYDGGRGHIPWDIFTQMKILFDYQKDKSTITEEPKGEGGLCSAKHETYLRTVKCAYETIQKKCVADGSHEWCTQFKQWFSDYQNQHELKFGCTLNNKGECAQEGSSSDSTFQADSFQSNSETTIISSALGTIAVGLPTIAFLLYKVMTEEGIIIEVQGNIGIFLMNVCNGECKVDQLPSRKIYAALGKNGKHTCTTSTSMTAEIENILWDKLKHQWRQQSWMYAQKIANAWCLLSTMNTKKEQSPPCSVICDFFYFWLGDQLHGKLQGGHNALKSAIQSIYTKLSDDANNGPCSHSFLQSTMSTEFLSRRKTIFDYYYDYRTIWKQIKNSQAEKSSSCTNAYDTYLVGADGAKGVGGAQNAYNMVGANCGTENHHDFCKKFRAKFKKDGAKGTIPEPSKLKEQAQSGGDDPPSDTSVEGEDGKNDLSSCLEELYSVVVASSKETSSHHSTSLQKEGNDSGSGIVPGVVTSAVGTTLVGLPLVTALLYKVMSTIFGKASTTVGSMEDESTIYNRRPLPRGAGNNNAPSHHRKNVAYHRMGLYNFYEKMDFVVLSL
ncbi:KIR protein [Plasmodium coatneyi]|uniref:KIR protein n=1 Tax=Plasmodium coatneyi TaxID=208452 RepID=A0A1B1DTQ4_9APIC|nr:KIR protein [Plasmodium coatneyi]ANQ05987.1 KIR protein [Plasmodium coatneyi]